MAKKKKENTAEPPVPYITPTEWIKEAIDFTDSIKVEVGLIMWGIDRHNNGEMEDHAFDEHVHDHAGNIEHLSVDLMLSLDRATVGASKSEDAISTALEELRTMWWRLKKLSA